MELHRNHGEGWPLTVLCRCTINTAQGYRVLNTQNNDKSNIKVQQAGREFNFEICGDGGYRSRMAQSYDNMVGPSCHIISCHVMCPGVVGLAVGRRWYRHGLAGRHDGLRRRLQH